MTRSGTGRYRVQLGGVGGAGGSANVTAYGTGTASCKLVAGQPNGTEELRRRRVPQRRRRGGRQQVHADVPRRRRDPRRASTGGLPAGARARQRAEQRLLHAGRWPSSSARPAGRSPSATPGPAGTGCRCPASRRLGGNAQVTALVVHGRQRALPAAQLVDELEQHDRARHDVSVRCFDAAGATVDAPFAMSFVR